MPKRTNAFQALITTLQRQMADRNVLVFESMELEGSAGPVEIDILIEFYINGHLYRTAIECRGQGRKQARPWIDELIGKVADRKLKIDKCIAVSESGFTRGALQRAAGAHIETLSLKEAENRDWSLLSRLPGLVQITSEVTPEIFELGFGFEEPDEVETAFAGHPLEYRRGNFNIRSTIPDVAGVCTAREFAGKFLLLPNFLSQHLDDSSRAHGRLTIKLSLKPGTTFALDPLGGFHQLLEFSIGVWIDRTISSVPVRQYEMGLSKFGSVTGEIAAGRITMVVDNSDPPSIAFTLSERKKDQVLSEIGLTDAGGQRVSVAWPDNCDTLVVRAENERYVSATSKSLGSNSKTVVIFNPELVYRLLGSRMFLGHRLDFIDDESFRCPLALSFESGGTTHRLPLTALSLLRPAPGDVCLTNNSEDSSYIFEIRYSSGGLSIEFGLNARKPKRVSQLIEVVRFRQALPNGGVLKLVDDGTGVEVLLPVAENDFEADDSLLVRFIDPLETISSRLGADFLLPRSLTRADLESVLLLSAQLSDQEAQVDSLSLVGSMESVRIAETLMNSTAAGSFMLEATLTVDLFGVTYELPRTRVVLFEPRMTVELRPDGLRHMLFESTGRKFVVSKSPELVEKETNGATGRTREPEADRPSHEA